MAINWRLRNIRGLATQMREAIKNISYFARVLIFRRDTIKRLSMQLLVLKELIGVYANDDKNL